MGTNFVYKSSHLKCYRILRPTLKPVIRVSIKDIRNDRPKNRQTSRMKSPRYCVCWGRIGREAINSALEALVDINTGIPIFGYKTEYNTTNDCYTEGRSEDYTGTITTTVSGRTCQRWDSHYPHNPYVYDTDHMPENSLTEAENYCRNPHLEPSVWCYTTDPDVRWDYCKVWKCLQYKGNEFFFTLVSAFKTMLKLPHRDTNSQQQQQHQERQDPNYHEY